VLNAAFGDPELGQRGLGGLDEPGSQVADWNVTKCGGQPPDIAGIGDQCDGPQPRATHDEPVIEVSARRLLSGTDWQSLAQRPASVDQPVDEVASTAPVKRAPSSTRHPNLAFPPPIPPSVDRPKARLPLAH